MLDFWPPPAALTAMAPPGLVACAAALAAGARAPAAGVQALLAAGDAQLGGFRPGELAAFAWGLVSAGCRPDGPLLARIAGRVE